jgi:uncharacterized protein
MWIALIVLLLWNGTLWLVLGLLIAPLLPGSAIVLVPLALLTVAPVIILALGFSGRIYPSAATRIWILRPFWYAQLFLPLLAFAGLTGVLAGWPFGIALTAGRILAGVAGVGLLVVSVWGYFGTRRLIVRALDLRFPALPDGLDGLCIVQLSDLHVGPHTSGRHLARVMEAARRARPDLIVLTGDQVDDFVRDVEPLRNALGGLSAPLGVVGVAGNHDVYAGWRGVRQGMERIGWKVLVNEAMPLERNGALFWLAGAGDPAGRGGPTGRDPTVIPDVDQTLARVPEGAFTIALAHNPALWPALADRGVDLTLSGHTHYGQFAVPGLQWSLASPFLKYAMGMHREGDSVLYINPGTNYWGVPLRIGALPEVTVLRLHGSV